MSDPSSASSIRVTSLVAVVATVSGSATFVVIGYGREWWEGYGVFVAILSVFCGALAWVAGPRQPRNSVIWVMAAIAVAGGAYNVGYAVALVLTDRPDVIATGPHIPATLEPGVAVVLMVAAIGGGLATSLLVTFGILLFPNGHLPSRRWRPVAIASTVTLLGLAGASGWTYRPNSSTPVDQGEWVQAADLALAVCAVLSLVSLIIRYTHRHGTTRAQIRWIAWGASCLVLAVVAAIVLGNTEHAAKVVPFVMLAEVLFLSAYGVAVTKYRLYDVDVVISRTVVYGTVVGILGLVYGGGVFVFNELLPFDNELAVAASTLLAVGLFNPLRTQVQRVVEQRFYRSRYDVQREIESFSDRLQGQIDLERVKEGLSLVVARTMHPARIDLWLRQPEELLEWDTTPARKPQSSGY